MIITLLLTILKMFYLTALIQKKEKEQRFSDIILMKHEKPVLRITQVITFM